MATEDIFVARYVPGKLLLMVLICVVGLVLFGWIALHPDSFQPRSALTRPAGIFGLSVLALLLLVNLREATRRGAVIMIGPQGLLWRRWSEERVPWHAFQAARFASTRGEEVLRLWLKETHLGRPRSLLGRVAAINRGLGAGDMELSTTGTDRRFEEMADAIYTVAPHLFSGDVDQSGFSSDTAQMEVQKKRAEDDFQLHAGGLKERDPRRH